MSGYTKGPWSYIGDDDGDFVVFAGEEFVCNIGESPFAAVSEHPETTIVAFDTDQANARLIAAAPDLHFCLKQIMSDLPANRDWLDPALEKMARAAIAKAESGKGGE